MYRRIVVKVGTHSICNASGVPSPQKIASIGHQLVKLMQKGVEVVLVSSGAVGAGAQRLLNGQRPNTLEMKQACAAVGQPILISLYRHFFEFYGYEVGQILVTGDVINERVRFLNARNTFFSLLQKKVIPIVNENDSVSVDEIKFGDNDNLAVNVAAVVEADACFILSDIEGLYKNFGQAEQELVREVHKIDDSIHAMVSHKKGGLSTGGMESKLSAALKSTKLGIPLIILPGYQEGILEDYFKKKKKPGTTFVAIPPSLKSKKKWIFLNFQETGIVKVDKGAYHALQEGKSLLPVGIETVEGNFERGDMVEVFYQDHCIGKGLVNYSSVELEQIKKLQSENIEKVLSNADENEAVHRDNFILMGD